MPRPPLMFIKLDNFWVLQISLELTLEISLSFLLLSICLLAKTQCGGVGPSPLLLSNLLTNSKLPFAQNLLLTTPARIDRMHSLSMPPLVMIKMTVVLAVCSAKLTRRASCMLLPMPVAHFLNMKRIILLSYSK